MRGTSILEVLVSISIFAVLATLSIPQAQELYSHIHFSLELERVTSTISSLPILAQQYEEDLKFEARGNSFRAASVRNPSASILAGTFRRGMSLSSHIQDPTPLEFIVYASGVATPQTLFFISESRRCAIVISLYGRVRHVCTE